MSRKSGSEDTLFRMLVKARQEPLTVTALALALHTVKGLRMSGPGAAMQCTDSPATYSASHFCP